MRSLFTSLLVAALLAGCTAGPGAPRPGASYANPVLDADFPDPAVLTADDGYYYAFATQGGLDGAMRNIQAARSHDLVSWEPLADALPEKPAWASKTQDFWAPHVSRHDGRYFLYYSAKPDAALVDGSRGLCLAVATADRPQGPYRDIGRPLLCGPGFVNIDPMAYDDPATGRRLLYWGSGFGPIKVQELAPDRISFAPGSKPVDLVHPAKSANPDAFPRLVEGAWVLRRGGWYYLFYSGDNCCGPNARYGTLVARSRSATGPFTETREPILALRGIWNAPGHNAVIADRSGRHWIVYHAVDMRRPRSRPSDEINTRRVMLIDPIAWGTGWPQIDGPSSGTRQGPEARRSPARSAGGGSALTLPRRARHPRSAPSHRR